MQSEEFDRLLAGYATNQLSAEETARLMEAAMSDQSLFNALADEDALRETLAEPQMKAELLQSLAPNEQTSFWSFLRRPQIWALAGTAAVAALAFVFLIRPQVEAPKATQIAQAPAPVASPPLAEAPQPVKSKPKVQTTPEKQAPASAPVVTESRREEELKRTDKKPEPARDEIAQLKKELDQSKDVKAEQSAPAMASPASPAPPPPPAPTLSAPRAAPAFRAMQNPMAKAKAVAAEPVAPVLQYTILRKNQQGEFVEAQPGADLSKGDAIRLAVTSRNRGYLSLTDPSTNRQLYYGLADAGTRYVLPSSGEVTLDASGTEKRLRLALIIGAGGLAGGGAGQSQVNMGLREKNAANQSASGMMADSNQANGPLSQSNIEIVLRYK